MAVAQGLDGRGLDYRVDLVAKDKRSRQLDRFQPKIIGSRQTCHMPTETEECGKANRTAGTSDHCPSSLYQYE